jgi:hypothetical protein
MSDKSVSVHFVPPNDWKFVDDTVEMKAEGKIKLEAEAGSTWTFESAEVKNGGPQFDCKVVSNGQGLHIHDKHTDLGTWSYRVTVLLDKVRYTSPDPQIVNSPSGMMDKSRSTSIPILVGLVLGAIVGALIDRYTGSPQDSSPFKGLIVGAVIGAAAGWLLARRKP